MALPHVFWHGCKMQATMKGRKGVEEVDACLAGVT